MEHWSDPGSFLPEEYRILTREELFTHAHEFAVELVRWKVWRVREHTQTGVEEARAMQALSLALVALLAGAQDSRAEARVEFARAAAFLGYALRDTAPQARELA
jgi:hypothetical protein